MYGRILAACLLVAGAISWALPSAALAVDVQPAGAAADASGGLRLAHSALLLVDADAQGDNLALRLRRARDQSPVSTDDVAVSVDGKSQTFTRGSDGSILLPLSELRGGTRTIDIVVGHDGIREVLSGTVKLPESSASTGLGNHKQLAWWVLNIIIVSIAAIAISRRKS